MTKPDLVAALAESMSRETATAAVETVLQEMTAALRRGERVELRGFGSFTVRTTKARKARNPRTGEEVSVPAGQTVRFKAGKELKARLQTLNER